MRLLRRYQLDIIFLFFALITLVWGEFYLLRSWGADPHDYEWLITIPLMIFYFGYLWKTRASIALADRRAATGKSLLYWIFLGVTLFSSYRTPVPASDYWSLNAFFLMFTLFLADSYWDFRALTVRSVTEK